MYIWSISGTHSFSFYWQYESHSLQNLPMNLAPWPNGKALLSGYRVPVGLEPMWQRLWVRVPLVSFLHACVFFISKFRPGKAGRWLWGEWLKFGWWWADPNHDAHQTTELSRMNSNLIKRPATTDMKFYFWNKSSAQP
jgi:hypothetical protein